MNNFNNQSNNDTNNNNVNITNEETMNYLTTLQSLLTNLTEEKATNERLHAVLDNNKALKSTVTSNNKVIKESIEEFEALLDCYKEENECLQKQYEIEGDLSSVVETQEAALAVIADIKKVLVPAEEVVEVAALSSQMEATPTVAEVAEVTVPEVIEEVTPSVVEETTSFWKEKPPARPVITEIAVTNDDFLRLTGKPRPTSQEEFMDILGIEEFDEGLTNYTSCLSKEAQYDFWFKNQDIVNVYYWESYAELEGLPTNKEPVQELDAISVHNQQVDSLNNLFYNHSSEDSTEE